MKDEPCLFPGLEEFGNGLWIPLEPVEIKHLSHIVSYPGPDDHHRELVGPTEESPK
jgi:hypothetical protein